MQPRPFTGSYSELEESMATNAGVAPQQARKWLIAFTNLAEKELLAGYDFDIYAIGSFRVRVHWRTNATSPRTHLPIGPRLIKSVRLYPAASLSDALN